MRRKNRSSVFYLSDEGICFDFPWGTKAIFFFKNSFPDFKVIFPKQNHTANILLYPDDFSGNGNIFFDGIITTFRDVALGVKTADCLPIAFSTPDLKGMIHAGWRGLARNIIQESIQKLQKISREDVSSAYFIIGPHICGKCYEVDYNVAEIFENLCKENNLQKINKIIRRGRKKGKFFINLSSFARFILQKLGVKNIFVSGICVKEDGRFFSRRRGDSSSQISIII